MIRLDVDWTRQRGVTRVRATVTNDRSTPQRVEIGSTLDGPVWAPRSGPLAVTEWSGSRWNGVVPTESTRGVGFATPAEPSEEPVEIVSEERADEWTDEEDSILEELERSSPPSAIVASDP
ncbi:DUF7857 domain-containing protein [Halorhabdus rudnickae]|uniref:DUF7857 domain-containing protein n=1 Tax=Halorhabdus rudnickae TaxID=1775544 RepID=UPI00108315C6|nr:hypothetical protein [Halorhabdus rudnickae]